MDDNLTIPVPRIPIPPPPLDHTLAIIQEAGELSRVTITNPLNYDNIPEGEFALNTMLAINRIREALSSPFNSPEPNFTRELWLKIILELFGSIHEGLYNCQTIATSNLVPYDAFDDLTAGEVGVTSHIKEILEGIDDFFWREGDADPPTRIHCYRCISSAAPPDPSHNPF
jgi:hypothetical protein